MVYAPHNDVSSDKVSGAFSKLRRLSGKYTGDFLSAIQNRGMLLAGDFASPKNLSGRLVAGFLRAAKEVPGYSNLRVRTARSKELETLQISHDQYSDPVFLTNARGKKSANDLIDNPIICFAGQCAYEHRQEAVVLGQYVKRVFQQTLPKETASEINKRIVSYGYQDIFGGDEELSDEYEDTNALKLLHDPHYCGPQARNFVKRFFEPRLSLDKDTDATLEPDVLARRLRMTLLGYSLGGGFIRQVLNGLEKSMLNRGYSPDEIQAGMSNIFTLSIAGIEPIKNPHANTGVEVLDVRDPVACNFVRDFRYHPDITGLHKRFTGTNSDVVWTEHSWEGIPVAQDISTRINEGAVSPLLGSHVSALKHSDLLPQQVVNALCASVTSFKSIPALDDMYCYDPLEPTEQELSYGKDAQGYAIYESDIAEALALRDEAAEIIIAVNMNAIDTKAAKDNLAAEVTDIFPSISKNKAKSFAAKYIARARDAAIQAHECDGQPHAANDLSI
jgi:hypothetical protein